MTHFKEFVKILIKKIPIPLSKNHRYDLQTQKILKQNLSKHSNCIDVGCHMGEIMDLMSNGAPHGQHFGFEPIPKYYQFLVEKYLNNKNIHLYNCALSEHSGETTFNFVKSNPAYSGIKERKFDRSGESVEIINVSLQKLDDLIPITTKIDLIKIDVEGAELLVLRGAKNIIKMHKPIVVFEHGLGGADVYGFGPKDVFDYFAEMDMHISNLGAYLKNAAPLTLLEFSASFEKGTDYYFVAHK